MTIGARLRQLRKSWGLTQDKLGELCDVSKGMVSQWELDIVTPPTDRLIELRKSYDFSYDWLIHGTPAVHKPVDPRRAHIFEVAQSLPEYALDAGVRDVDNFVELIRSLPAPEGVAADGNKQTNGHG